MQCPIIFHMCTTDPSLFHVLYSKFLNSGFNALCPLLAGFAFVDFTAPCSKNRYVAEYLSFFISLSFSLPILAFGWIYSRIPKLMYSSCPKT